MTEPRRDEWGQFAEGNQANLKHGAYSYLAAKKDGRAISMEARAIEVEIENELAEKGPGGMAEQEAITQGTAARMLWRYMLTSEQNFWKALRVWGWLTNSFIRNLEKAQAMRKARDNTIILDAIAKAEETTGD